MQEVLVQDLFPKYSSGRDRYDIVLPDIKLIIECHGIQHYKVQTFGAKAEDAVMNFQLQKKRDAEKKEIALLNGWAYLEIPYTDEKVISDEYIHKAYTELQSQSSVEVEQAKRPDPTPPSDYQIRQRELARNHRREQYRRMKEFKDANRRSSKQASGSSEEET